MTSHIPDIFTLTKEELINFYRQWQSDPRDMAQKIFPTKPSGYTIQGINKLAALAIEQRCLLLCLEQAPTAAQAYAHGYRVLYHYIQVPEWARPATPPPSDIEPQWTKAEAELPPSKRSKPEAITSPAAPKVNLGVLVRQIVRLSLVANQSGNWSDLSEIGSSKHDPKWMRDLHDSYYSDDDALDRYLDS